jgi:Resolvase, N terminal domain/Helix-turn-helix domain of resolvase
MRCASSRVMRRAADRPPARPRNTRREACPFASEQPIDISTAAGKCSFDMLGVLAEFETNLRRERQLEGIAKAKAQGVYKGRKASIDPARVKQLKADGLGPTEIARTLKIGRASVYRVLGQIEPAASNTSRAYGGPAPHTGQNSKLRQRHSIQDESGADDKAHRPGKY